MMTLINGLINLSLGNVGVEIYNPEKIIVFLQVNSSCQFKSR